MVGFQMFIYPANYFLGPGFRFAAASRSSFRLCKASFLRIRLRAALESSRLLFSTSSTRISCSFSDSIRCRWRCNRRRFFGFHRSSCCPEAAAGNKPGRPRPSNKYNAQAQRDRYQGGAIRKCHTASLRRYRPEPGKYVVAGRQVDKFFFRRRLPLRPLV